MVTAWVAQRIRRDRLRVGFVSVVIVPGRHGVALGGWQARQITWNGANPRSVATNLDLATVGAQSLYIEFPVPY